VVVYDSLYYLFEVVVAVTSLFFSLVTVVATSLLYK